MRNLFKASIVVIVLAFISGCGLSTPVVNSPISTYAIAPRSFVVTSRVPKTASILLLNDVVANPGYTTDKMLYMTLPFRLKSFSYNEWVAPPAKMIGGILRNSLEQTAYFKAIVMPPYMGQISYALAVRLLRLEQDFSQPVSVERLVLQATLLNESTHHVIASQTFKQSVSAPGNDPYSGVLAANTAATKVSARMARFVVAALLRHL